MVFVFLYRFYWSLLLLFLLPILGMGMTIHKDRLIDMPVSNHGARVRLILRRYTFNKHSLIDQTSFNHGCTNASLMLNLCAVFGFKAREIQSLACDEI